MGNAASDAAEEAAVARVARLKDEIADVERAVRQLGRRPQIDLLLPHQVRVEGLVLGSNPDVRVLLGPVVGKVDLQSARVLLEVDRAVAICCHVLVHDARVDAMVELPHCQMRVQCSAGRPMVFHIRSLVPGRLYRVVFSGIHREDVIARKASFETPTLDAGNRLRCAVVSADDPYELEYGEASLWAELRRSIVDERRVQLVLHLGGQIAMQRMFDKAWSLMVRHAECMQPHVTFDSQGDISGKSSELGFASAWATIESQAMEILRSAYRTQWNLLHDKQQVLASASNLMMWSDWDVYPAFTTREEFIVDHEQPTIEMQVLRTVTRCARRLYHEYQRALWDQDLDQLFERETELREVAEKALSTTARVYQLTQQIPAAEAEVELQKKRREIESARKAERHLRALEGERLKYQKQLVSYNQLLAPQGGEEFFCELGAIGILFVDMRSARLEAGGSQCADNEILSNKQWENIERFLERENIKLLVVASEAPVVDDLPHEVRRASPNECDFKTWWCMNANAQQRMLGLAFEWKLQQPDRQVVLLSGSSNSRFSMKTTVKDSRLRADIMQVVTGPMTSITNGSLAPKKSGVLFDRYAYNHVDIDTAEKSFVYLNCQASAVAGRVDEAFRVCNVVGKSIQDLAMVLLGPIVGFVDSTSAVILLEVDRRSDLVCVLDNPLTGECRRVFQHFEPHRPQTFFVNHLRSEHHYNVSFERIQNPTDFKATFTTLAKSPTHFEVIAIGSISSQTRTPSPLWSALVDNIGIVPFRSVDMVLHFESDPKSDVAALLVHGEDDACVTEKVRELYRMKWRMPGVSHVLANGGRLLLQRSRETVEHGDPRYLMVQQCIQQVHFEYANLLLPPSKRASSLEDRAKNPVCIEMGNFGIFVLPTGSPSGASMREETWQRLDDFLQSPMLSSLLLVTHEPIVEDSIEDIEEKARFHNAYRKKFSFHRRDLQRMLETLYEWQHGLTPGIVQRQVFFLAGHDWRSFASVIQEVAASSDPKRQLIRCSQYAVGPFDPVDLSKLSSRMYGNVFPQGSLFDKFVYFHQFLTRRNPVLRDACGTEDVASSLVSVLPSVSQFLHVVMHMTQEIDDKSRVAVSSTFVSSCLVDMTPQQDAAAEFGVPTSLVHLTPASGVLGLSNWSLQARQPSWLESLLSRPLAESEVDAVKELEELLMEKSSEVEASFHRHAPLTSGLVAINDRSSFLHSLRSALEHFYHQWAGTAFRAKCSIVPSIYVIDYTIEEFIQNDADNTSVGAMDVGQYRSLASKCFTNAWLFETRLRDHWA